MGKEALATKYRPRVFEDVTAQDYTVKILEKQIETHTIKNCYLLTGPAGTGKTTLGRILASRINDNKGSPIEIDAATNSSAENVRTIVEEAKVRSLDSYYKVYILDECHAFSSQAWQAFLKCLEEPPERSIFIFCTTDPQKIPQTIISRVQRFDVQRIPVISIVNRLKFICKEENFKFDEDALEYIAKLASGGMRDAITMLDKVSSYTSYIKLTDVISALGVTNYGVMFELTNFIIDRKELECLSLVDDLYQKGKDLKLFLSEYVYFLLDVNKYILKPDFTNIKIPIIYKQELDYISDFRDANNVNIAKKLYGDLLSKLVEMQVSVKWETNIKSNFELNILKFCRN